MGEITQPGAVQILIVRIQPGNDLRLGSADHLVGQLLQGRGPRGLVTHSSVDQVVDSPPSRHIS